MALVKNEKFKIVKGEEKLKLYQFHTKVAKHFCSECGIYIITIKDKSIFNWI